MSNQRPAEALSFELQNILRPITIMMYMPPTIPPTVQEAMKLEAAIEKEITEAVTAYAATVEREARIDELKQLDFDTVADRRATITFGQVEDRLAALQGPIQEKTDE